MKHATWKTALALALLLLAGGSRPALAAPQVVDLGTLPGAEFSRAMAVNGRGNVAANAFFPDLAGEGQNPTRAFFWSPATGGVDLGVAPGWDESFAAGMNDANLVVANMFRFGGDLGFEQQVFVLRLGPAGQVLEYVDLGLPPGALAAAARGINNRGHVVGFVLTEEFDQRGFFWSEATGFVDLGTLGGEESLPTGINDDDQVALDAENDEGVLVPARFRVSAEGEVTERLALAISPGAFPGTTRTEDLNAAGAVVGWDRLPNSVQRALLWRSPDEVSELGRIPGGIHAQARAINDLGQVVGTGTTALQDLKRGWVWTPQLGMQDLSRVVGSQFVEVLDAFDINNRLQVAASGRIGAAEEHALLLNLCPVDITSLVNVRVAAIRVLPPTGEVVQVLEIRNRSRFLIPGPAFLRLDGLQPAQRPLNATGLTSCPPANRPYVTVDVGADGALLPGERVQVVLRFPRGVGLRARFTPRFLAGGSVP